MEAIDPDKRMVILERTEHWVVVAKPPRLLVHRAPGAEADHYALQLTRDTVGTYVHPIHRLDRPTSGCLLFALDRDRIPALQQALGADDAVKTYLAFVRGRWSRGDGAVVVDNPMTGSGGEKIKEAESEVECLGASAEPRCSLLRVRPRTGRYHQVRRHVRDLDHPVIGDSSHGDTRVNRWWREQYGLSRLGLHCASLDLPLPDGGRLQAQCPLFDDLHAVWRQMPWWSQAVSAEPVLGLSPVRVPDYLRGDVPD